MVKIKGISSASPAAPELPAPPRPDPEVSAGAKRRAFTAEYKRILAEADVAIAQPGAIGGMLRCEKVGFG
jgi:hypothetical protein